MLGLRTMSLDDGQPYRFLRCQTFWSQIANLPLIRSENRVLEHKARCPGNEAGWLSISLLMIYHDASSCGLGSSFPARSPFMIERPCALLLVLSAQSNEKTVTTRIVTMIRSAALTMSRRRMSEEVPRRNMEESRLGIWSTKLGNGGKLWRLDFVRPSTTTQSSACTSDCCSISIHSTQRSKLNHRSEVFNLEISKARNLAIFCQPSTWTKTAPPSKAL